jgi:HPt (histidine-containing phosphotransfer) domain-containing protein/CheY-like chemotaxis protein
VRNHLRPQAFRSAKPCRRAYEERVYTGGLGVPVLRVFIRSYCCLSVRVREGSPPLKPNCTSYDLVVSEQQLKLRKERADFTLERRPNGESDGGDVSKNLAFVEKAFIMNSLRFLLVHRNPEQSEEIAALLVRANHSVLPTSGLEEAADALTVERFDAVLLESEFRTHGLKEFCAQLRLVEQSQRGAVRVPVIGLTHDSIGDIENGLDAVIPEPIDPHALTAAAAKLAQAVSGSAQSNNGSDTSSLVVIDPDKFREQVGFDSELMVEIIDLFLGERERQEPEMREALMAKEFEVLSRLAHTIKGSLGSLHALRARSHAQDLEIAAKQGNEDVCWELLAALEADLAELEPELQTLREG